MNSESTSEQRRPVNAITEGAIGRQLLIFFFPILFGTFFQQLYNTADAIIVGQLVGKEALASVGGTTGSLINLFVGFFVGLASGCAVTISQYYGAVKDDMVSRCVHTSIAFSVIVGAALTIIGLLGTPLALNLMKVPPDIFNLASIYLRIYFCGMIFNLIYNMGAAILRAVGDSKRPLYFLIASCFTNILLDLLFIAVLHMGVAGAALATILSQGVSAVLVIVVLIHTHHSYKLHVSQIKIDPPILKRMIFIGFPAGMQSAMYNIANVIIQSTVNTFGTDTIAAWTALGKIDSLYWMISQALNISITTFVGQNYGAGKYSRMKKGIRLSLLMDLVMSAIICVAFLILGRYIYMLFTTDADVIDIGVKLIGFFAPTYFTYIFIEIYSGSLRGIGDTWMPLIMTFLGVCVLRIVWVLGVTPSLPKDILNVSFSYPFSWVVTSIAFVIYFHKFSKIKKIMSRE